ncbi:MarR family transcriptional regulator [Pseudomonas sp.]|uniref:MarR family transcriptional regulator n=1 Tax=Pseudomonas sp. TaxID=306 RepID=UPI0028A9730C|nr:MarR family transcriptional regulator [Pseudomonas sp.]
MYPEQHRFAMQLAQLSRGWRAELDRRLADLDLSQARWLVLLHLARFDHDPTQRELAQSVAVEGPTLARLLDSLEAQGLVHRQPAPGDRRAKLITLGAPARPLIQRIEAISTQVREELFEGIDDDDLRMCQQVHERILANLVRVKR